MWKMMAVPIIGALIGYATNWIAVKMLFRPRYEMRIGGWKVPFTPGVIPKGQPRLAKAIGKAVETQLLPKEIVKEMLLSERIKNKLTSSVEEWVRQRESSLMTVKDGAYVLMDEESYYELKAYIREEGAGYIYRSLMEQNPAQMMGEKIKNIANEYLSSTMFGAFLGPDFIDSIGRLAESKINEYLEAQGEEYIGHMIGNELEKFQEKRVGDFLTFAEDKGLNVPLLILTIYEEMIEKNIEVMLASLDLSKVVEDRINSMKVEEVEELVLDIMNKELGAIVNLGALIGLVLGLINVAILCI